MKNRCFLINLLLFLFLFLRKVWVDRNFSVISHYRQWKREKVGATNYRYHMLSVNRVKNLLISFIIIPVFAYGTSTSCPGDNTNIAVGTNTINGKTVTKTSGTLGNYDKITIQSDGILSIEFSGNSSSFIVGTSCGASDIYGSSSSSTTHTVSNISVSLGEIIYMSVGDCNKNENYTITVTLTAASNEPNISIAPTSKSITEGTASVSLDVVLSEAGNKGSIDVDYSGTCGASGTVTIAKGSTSNSITIDTSTLATGTSCTVKLDSASGNTGQEVGSISPDTSVITVLGSAPDLNITKIASVSSIEVDQNITYTIIVGNHGTASASNVIVTDILPSGVTVNSATGTGWDCTPISANPLVCTLSGDLAINTSSSIDINITVLVDNSIITNEANVSCDNEINLNDNNTSVDVEVGEVNSPDLCYMNSRYSDSHPNTCSAAGVSYFNGNPSYTCVASIDIRNQNAADTVSSVVVYKVYNPDIDHGTCSTTKGNCTPLTTSSFGKGHKYTLEDMEPNRYIKISDTDSYYSGGDISNISLYATYQKNGTDYSIQLDGCIANTPSDRFSKIDTVDPSMYPTYATAPIIKTKISKKDNQQFTAVYIDPETLVEKIYTADVFLNAPIEAFLYLSDSQCNDELPLAEPVTGSPVGEPVIAHIAPDQSTGDTNVFTMKAIANKDARIKIRFVDWSQALGDLSSASNCFNNSNWEGNFNGLPQCLNQLGSNGGLSQEFIAKYPHISTICLQDDTGDAACDSNAYNNSGSRGNIYPEKYNHAYGCLACILDAIGDTISCSRDNFAIRPDYFDINNLTDDDFPNLLRAGEDYNLSVYAYDYGITSGTVGTHDYNQTKSNLDLNQTHYFANNTEDTANLLHGTLVWSVWDFNITNGISHQGTTLTPTEVAGVQYNDVGKISLRVEDRNWAAVDINNPNDPTTHDCAPDGAYVCGDKNVTYIPHHFRFADLNITNHAGPDSNFTYIAERRGMPSTGTLPTRSPMAARVEAKIEALTKNDDVTQNFRTEATSVPYDPVLYYENPVSITLKVTVPSSGKNTYLYPDANESNVTNSYIGFGRAGAEENGTRIVKWDEADFPLDFNFRRDIDKEANPFDVNGTYLTISILSHYIDPDDGDTADINGTGMGDDDYNANPTACDNDEGCQHLNADKNATFYYGRAKSSKYFYEDIRTASANTPITVTVYCKDNTFVDCNNDYRFVTPGSTEEHDDETDEKYWYLSMEHNASRGDGNITIMIGSYLIEPEGNATTDQEVVVYGTSHTPGDAGNVKVTSDGIENDVNVTRGSNPNPPLTVPVELVIEGDIAAPPYTNEWLIYNKFFPAAPTPFYKVRFIGASTWTGEGKTGYVVDTNASYKKTKRLDW